MRCLRRKSIAIFMTIFVCATTYYNIQYFATVLSTEGASGPTNDLVLRRTSVGQSLGLLEPRNLEELTNTVIPNTAFYIWCGNETFTYKYYLSVQSVWKHLEPESITVYYKILPQQDDYNDWLDRLTRSIPNLHLEQLQRWVKCDKQKELLIDLINDQGGLYVSLDTVILKPVSHLRKRNFTVFTDSKENIKLFFASPGKRRLVRTLPYFRNTEMYMQTEKGKKVETRLCQQISSKMNDLNGTVGECGYLVDTIYPTDIIAVEDPIASCLRYVAYGQTDPIHPRVNRNTLIPKVVHYVWYNQAIMTFMMYLSVLSSLFVINADAVYIHGGNWLAGPYFEKVKVMSRVKVINRDPPRYIFGKRVTYTHHKSDVMRGDILQKYGGIYMDWDALWVNPIDDLIAAGYDVILSLDHSTNRPFPHSINMGVVLSKPRSKFIEIWRNSYREYKTDKFFYNPVQMPFKVYESHPNLVKIEPRLQVMCFRLKCHPTFHPDFRDLEHGQPFNWKSDVYALHFTHPDPEEFQSEEALKQGSGMFADIGKHILKLSSSHLSQV